MPELATEDRRTRDGRTRSSCVRHVLVCLASGLGVAVLGVVASTAWISLEASGHVHRVADAPSAPVVIVLGSKVVDGEPMSFLQGRLDTAAELLTDGRAKAVLVSGNGSSETGNEAAVMAAYLEDKGIDEDVIVADPYGLDTYDTCARAVRTYGISQALIVTQGLHVSRAVALCRDAGIDVDGVNGTCECSSIAFAQNQARELLARPKALHELVAGRDPSVVSPPENSVTALLDE